MNFLAPLAVKYPTNNPTTALQLKKIMEVTHVVSHVYCYVLGKSATNTFESTSNGQSFKIRQKIDCQSQNIIYLITCKRCNLQGVGLRSKFSSRISNCFSHIKQKKKTCIIANRFIDNHYDIWNINYAVNEIISIIGIAKITNLPFDPK